MWSDIDVAQILGIFLRCLTSCVVGIESDTVSDASDPPLLFSNPDQKDCVNNRIFEKREP